MNRRTMIKDKDSLFHHILRLSRAHLKRPRALMVFGTLISALIFMGADLEPIPTENTVDATPVGVDHYDWVVVATFPQSRDIIKLGIFLNGDLLIINDRGVASRLDGEDPSRALWSQELSSDQVFNVRVAPDGETFAVNYKGTSGVPTLEIRSGDNGQIKYAIPRPIDYCGFDSDLQPWELRYSSNSKRLLARYNAGTGCTSLEYDELVVIDVRTGEIEAKRQFTRDLWPPTNPNFPPWKCGMYFPIEFDAEGESLVVLNCNGWIARYNTATLELDKVTDFSSSIDQIVENQVGPLIRKNRELHSVHRDINGDYLAIWGAQGVGILMKISASLDHIEFYTVNQGAVFSYMERSPNDRWFMANYEYLNVWNMDSGRFVISGRTWGAYDLARFHSQRESIVVARGKHINILARRPISEVEIGADFTPTGHWLTAYNGFCVHGPGDIVWAFGDYEVSDSYARPSEDICMIGITTGRDVQSVHLNEETTPQSAELRLKTSEPGTFTIIGGATEPKTDLEVWRSLPTWGGGAVQAEIVTLTVMMTLTVMVSLDLMKRMMY